MEYDIPMPSLVRGSHRTYGFDLLRNRYLLPVSVLAQTARAMIPMVAARLVCDVPDDLEFGVHHVVVECRMIFELIGRADSRMIVKAPKISEIERPNV